MYFYCFSYFFSLAAIAARWSPLTQLACVASSFPAQYAHSMPSVRYRILASRANPRFHWARILPANHAFDPVSKR